MSVLSYAALSDALVALQQNSAPYGSRLLHLSDSFAQQQVGTTGGTEIYKSPAGAAVCAEMLSLGRLTCDTQNIKGVNGQTTAQILARVGTDALQRKDQWDIALVDGGRNDPTTGLADAINTTNNLKSAASQINKKSGKLAVVMLPNPPRSLTPDGATDRLVRGAVNNIMRPWTVQQNIPMVDPWRDCADSTSPGGGAWATGMSSDTLHPNTLGARIFGLRVIDSFGTLVPGTILSQPAWDTWDPTINPNGNAINQTGATVPFLQGTGGTLAGTGLSGSLATGCFCNLYSGTATNVASKVAATAAAGYKANSTDLQVFTISNVTVAAGWEFYSGFNVPAGLAGRTVVLEFLVNMANLSSPGAMTFAAYGRAATGGFEGDFLNGTFYANESLLVRTAPFNIGNSGQFFQWSFGFFAAVGASGVISLSNPVVRPQ